MAQCKQSPQDFIKNAFTPQVAVISTPLAEKCCQKNNLNFIELLQPFTKLTTDVQYKDPNGVAISIRNLKLTFLNVNDRPPQTTLARKLLNSSVSEAPDPKNKLFVVGDYKLDLPMSTPWFEAWRDTFLRVQYPSDHEYTKHFLACLLVVSSADSNPVESMIQLAQTLNQMQSIAPGKLPKWFSLNVLKYYIILQDNIEGNYNSAIESFESLKSSYGASNCFLLRMNSRPPGPVTDHFPDPWSQFINEKLESKTFKPTPESSPNIGRNTLEIGQEANENRNIIAYHPLSPDTDDPPMTDISNEIDKPVSNISASKPHGNCLSAEDIEQVKLLVFEFTKCCLLPYIEKQMAQLSDVISNKKGMSKSLFSATKRWFSPNKPGAGSVAVNNLIYAPDSPELQVRRLGDLYFMFGNYSGAFQAYHLAKRDYNTDQAWLYYAGALEMAALAAFMANDSNRKTFDYMEESITTYLNTCKMPQFATRATILSTECLKQKNMFGDAALQLIRMTSEESDLRSALLLEQAAYCFLHSKMMRKYAFHMVLAGHRYSKAAQRKHSLRSYKQAYKIYENTGWDLASDHIHYTIGRQANNLQQYDEAVQSFSHLLQGSSKQSGQQQALFLKEYLTILGNKLNNETMKDIPILPVPELNCESIKMLVGPTRPLSTPGKVPALGVSLNTVENSQTEARWNKLEEMLVHEAEGSQPMVFKPMITLYTLNKLEKNNPIAIINEPIQISVELSNTLQTVLHLKEIYLIWTFKSDGVNVSNELSEEGVDHYVKTHTNKSIIIQGNQTQDLTLSIIPLFTGQITILGVCYTLTGSTTESIFIKGKQPICLPNVVTKNNQKNDNKSKRHLEINVVPSAPCLQVTFSDMNLDFLTNELQRVCIDFQNNGSVPLKNVYMATSVPNLLSSCEFKPVNNTVSSDDVPRDKLARQNHVTSVPLPNNLLEPGQSTSIYIWIKAPDFKGSANIDLLIYYENVDSKSVPRYRLVRHNWNLSVQESIAIDISLQESHNSKTVEELALAIKATNLNKIHNSISTEITLLNVGVLSKFWKLTKNMVTHKYINLHMQESAHILLKAKRINKQKSVYSSISLYSSDRKHIQNFNVACQSFPLKVEQYQVNVFDNPEVQENVSVFKDGLLCLQWQALVTDSNTKKIVYGQTILPVEVTRTEQHMLIDVDSVIDINKDEKVEENKNELLKKQVTYNLLYNPNVEHDFSKDKLCIIPIKLLIHSVVNDDLINVTVNTIDASVSSQFSRSNMYYPYASSQFRWLGRGKTIKNLQPLSTSTVNLSVVVSTAGTFNLGARIEVLCNKLNETPILQSCQIHSALIVNDVNS